MDSKYLLQVQVNFSVAGSGLNHEACRWSQTPAGGPFIVCLQGPGSVCELKCAPVELARSTALMALPGSETRSYY